MSRTTAIIAAGGSGIRMGLAMPKQFAKLAGIPILVHAIRAFQDAPSINAIIVVAPENFLEQTKKLIDDHGLTCVTKLVPGGVRRQDSVFAGLTNLPADCEIVAVHDGARPLISPALIERCILEAAKYGAAIAALPVKDTLKSVGQDSMVRCTVDRAKLWQAQTPQVVRRDWLEKAYEKAAADNFTATDEASLLEYAGLPVRVVEGAESNIKITRPEDLLIAEALLMNTRIANDTGIRVGHGYDAHRLVKERPLILGGVKIPHELGLLGHSDADVLLHALCDAILGALGLGDIGQHFPDSAPEYEGTSSLLLLKDVARMAAERGFYLLNCDITVVAQRPKLAGYFPEMKTLIATTCEVEEAAINLKATTTEHMGFTGREEGIAAHAVVLMKIN